MKKSIIFIFILSGILYCNGTYYVSICDAKYSTKVLDGNNIPKGGRFYEVNKQAQCYIKGAYRFTHQYNAINKANKLNENNDIQ